MGTNNKKAKQDAKPINKDKTEQSSKVEPAIDPRLAQLRAAMGHVAK